MVIFDRLNDSRNKFRVNFVFAVDSSNKPPIGTTPRGSGIDETHLQANFRRKNLTLDEIEAINVRK